MNSEFWNELRNGLGDDTVVRQVSDSRAIITKTVREPDATFRRICSTALDRVLADFGTRKPGEVLVIEHQDGTARAGWMNSSTFSDVASNHPWNSSDVQDFAEIISVAEQSPEDQTPCIYCVKFEGETFIGIAMIGPERGK